LRQEGGRDCQSAWDRDSLSAVAATERQAGLMHWAAQNRVRQPQGERQKAV
jgi:hypothetical protein